MINRHNPNFLTYASIAILQYVQISSGLNHYFLGYLVHRHKHRQTDIHTDRHTDGHEHSIVAVDIIMNTSSPVP